MIRKLYWRIRLLLELNRSDIKSIMKEVFPPKEFILIITNRACRLWMDMNAENIWERLLYYKQHILNVTNYHTTHSDYELAARD